MKALTQSLVLFCLIGCASAPPTPEVAPAKLVALERGMSKKQVEGALGFPDDRTFRGNQEHWFYRRGPDGKGKLIILENDKVVDMLNADEKSNALHEAKPDEVDLNRDGRCRGNNTWGKFAEGGGCNLYGCWPAGGYCNQWGCSSTGRCTVTGCPNKIDSYRCRD